MTPRVSIVLPVRDEERHLPDALSSVFRQSLRDWELVAVDDGSGDGTPEILAEAAGRDPRVRVLSRRKEGLVAALNAGLEACRAPLTARMDGDDICHPERLRLQCAFMEKHPETTVLGCGVRHFPRPRLQGGMIAYEAWQNSLLTREEIGRDLYVESPFAHPSVMYRRQEVLAAGGYQDCGWAEDYDLWLRLARSGAIFARLPRVLFFWRDRPERLTRTAPNCSAEAFRACKLHHLRKGFLHDAREVILWGAGAEGKSWRQTLSGEKIRIARWAEVDPRKIGQRIHGAPVIPIEELKPGIAKILVTIGAKGARKQVREWAGKKGLVEGRDFICVT